jgi:hypothetical protein
MARTILKSKQRVYLALGAVGLLALIVVGTAYAITSSSFKYSSTKTGYLSVSHMDFIPDGPNTTYFNSWTGGLTDSGGGCFNAGINLPSGAKVKSVTWFYESGAGSEFFGRFVRMNMPTAAGLDITANASPVNNTGLPSSVTRNVAAANQTVNNSRYSYGIGACPGSDGVFNGARVKYTYRTAGS